MVQIELKVQKIFISLGERARGASDLNYSGSKKSQNVLRAFVPIFVAGAQASSFT